MSWRKGIGFTIDCLAVLTGLLLAAPFVLMIAAPFIGMWLD